MPQAVVLPLIERFAAGAALRAGAAGAAEGGAAEGGASSFGTRALRMGAGHVAANRIAHHGGVGAWAKANPGEAAFAGGATVVQAMTAPGLAGHAAAQFQSVIQPQQFGR